MLHVCASGSIKIGELINGFFSFSDYCELFLCVFNTEGKKRRLLHFLTVVDFNLTLLNLLMEESFVSCGVKDSLALQHVNPPLLAFSDRFPLSLFPFPRCPFLSLFVGIVPKRFLSWVVAFRWAPIPTTACGCRCQLSPNDKEQTI